jgi:arylsulfatase A-like enzyme
MRRAVGTLLALAAAGLAVHGSLAPRPLRRPNIVVILIDTLRSDHLPVYGYPRNTAPFLSELAEHGAVFDHAYSTSGWTSPATASLFTSLYPFQHGVVHAQEDRLDRLPTAVKTLAEVLQAAGYATYGVSGNVLVSEETGFSRGFRRFAHAAGGPAELLNKTLKKWRDEILGSRPYFVYVHYMDPHEPYMAAGPWFDEFMADGLKTLANPTWVAAYDSEIRLVDSKIEGLFRSFGWGEDTLVVVTADHGEEFRDHGRGGHAHTLYGELLDVPLLVYWPGRVAPGRLGAPVSLIDVLPTLREVAGLPMDPEDQGSSLLPLLRSRSRAPRPRSLYAYLIPLQQDKAWRAAIRDGWKLIFTESGKRMLFDLSHDPHEKDNLIGRDPGVAETLGKDYRSFEARADKYSAEQGLKPSAETLHQLELLGYVR